MVAGTTPGHRHQQPGEAGVTSPRLHLALLLDEATANARTLPRPLVLLRLVVAKPGALTRGPRQGRRHRIADGGTQMSRHRHHPRQQVGDVTMIVQADEMSGGTTVARMMMAGETEIDTRTVESATGT